MVRKPLRRTQTTVSPSCRPQKELDSLLDEVDRISEATNFNGINLLDGSLGGAKVTTTTGTAARKICNS